MTHKKKEYALKINKGAHLTTENGCKGVHFSVWAPRAIRVFVAGDFNNWDYESLPMEYDESTGIYHCFSKEAKEYDRYQYVIETRMGEKVIKSDPYGFCFEKRPKKASIIYNIEKFKWTDDDFVKNRDDGKNKPVFIYEVHLASFARDYGSNAYDSESGFLNYRHLAHKLGDYIEKMGYTHVELMGIMEHPLDKSWGYQITGYFSPTSRYGSPEDFAYMVNYLHSRKIGVILDWVPSHFPKDSWALSEFDGTDCYECSDKVTGENPQWGTKVFDYGKKEVRDFLIENACFWIEKYHIDGLRADAVASILYLDFGRTSVENVEKIYHTRENVAAIKFLREMNRTIRDRYKGVMVIAEESSAYRSVTKDEKETDLGFTYKWNMGWMNDTLEYMRLPAYYRGGRHKNITFTIMYAFDESFILPISHDEVVHLKASLYNKMPGDMEEKFKNIRLFFMYMVAYPGKKLLFMGQDFGMLKEWDEKEEIQWYLLREPEHRSLSEYVRNLISMYKMEKSLYLDDGKDSFLWVSLDDKEKSLFSFIRKYRGDFEDSLLFVFNFSGLDFEGYEIKIPEGLKCTKVMTSFEDKPDSEGTQEDINIKNGSIFIDLRGFEAIIFKLSH